VKTKIILFILSGFLTGIDLDAEASQNDDTRPNVVFLLSDDQGWTDYGFMGHPHIQTPHLDRLASQGILYERGYVTAPLCRPSLASIATGLHPHQIGIRGNDPVGWAPYIRSGEFEAAATLRRQMTAPVSAYTTFIEVLQANGYSTLQTGKWWEGNPLDHGFDRAMTHGDPMNDGRHGDKGLEIGRQTLEPIYNHINQAIADHKPFFIWYGVYLPHFPHDAPARLFNRYKSVAPNEPTAWYWANCEWLDETVGEIVEFLKKTGVYENTIFVYTCDNGWRQNPEKRHFPDGSSKQEPTEMGIRTPIFMTHGGTIEPRRDSRTLASNIDIAPTILKACGTEVPDVMSGLDLRDKKALQRRDRVFVDVYEHDMDLGRIEDIDHGLKARVVIDGWNKLIFAPNGVMLFDLESDNDDRKNLAEDQPEKVSKLAKMMERWLNATPVFDADR